MSSEKYRYKEQLNVNDYNNCAIKNYNQLKSKCIS